MKRCISCKKELQKDFTYCPYCGETVSRNPFSNLFHNMNKKIIKMDQGPFKLPFGGISITIKPGHIRTVRRVPVERMPIKRSIRANYGDEIVQGDVFEPKATLRREGNKVHIEISLPGVESIDDVFITPMAESIEIKAKGKDKTYFKVMKTPKNSQIVNEELKNGKLVLTLA